MTLKVKRALREICVWLLAVLAAAGSFSYFETAWKALGNAKSLLAVTSEGSAADVTSSIKPASESNPYPIGQPRMIIDAGSWTPVVTALPSQTVPSQPRSVLLQANSYGHFHVEAKINGKPVELMTDTGATYVALSYESAINLGFNPLTLKFSGRSNTANGVARVAPVTLQSIRIGDIEIKNVAAVIAEQGKMSQNLLGMSFIAKLTRFELRGNKLVLVQ